MPSTHKHHIPLILTAILLFLAPMPIEPHALPNQSHAHALPGCTTLYAYDGETALAGNNEDLNNPLTLVWFIPASQGRFGRVYFGYDDYIPQGGLNDQGVFFDGLALPYKAMPVTSQRPHFPGGDMAFMDEILSRSANVQDAIDITSRWNRVGGEYGQNLIWRPLWRFGHHRWGYDPAQTRSLPACHELPSRGKPQPALSRRTLWNTVRHAFPG